MYLVNGRIIAVKESGKGTCIGCSMDPVRSVNMGKICTEWFAFVSYFECSARMWRENPG